MLEIYSKIPSTAPSVMQRFSRQLFREEDLAAGEEDFFELFRKYDWKLQKILEHLLVLWDLPENRKTLGHDRIHISYDLLEFLYLSVSLKESERRMVLFGSLLHDLGRYPELLFREKPGAMDFSKTQEIQLHAALSAYLAWLLSKIHRVPETDPQIVKSSKIFGRRVLAAVLFHGGKNETRDAVAHHVQSVDRLAGILGIREFVRNVCTDGVMRGAAVYPDERLSYARTFPLFNNLPVKEFVGASEPQKSWTNIIHYLEMPLRNMYPLSTNEGTGRSLAMKRESGIILTLLSGGKGAPLYKQIFAPELGLVTECRFPKTKIPATIWQEIEAGPSRQEEEEMQRCKSMSLVQVADLMLGQQAPDITQVDREKVHCLLQETPAHHQVDLARAIQFVVAKRALCKKSEKSFLEEMENSSDAFLRIVARHLLQIELFS